MTPEQAEQIRPEYEKLKAESLAIAADVKTIRSTSETFEGNAEAQIIALRTRVDDVEHRMRSLNSSILHFFNALERIDPIIPKAGKPSKEGKA